MIADSTQKKLDMVLGKALRDSEFRQRLISAPRSAAAELDLTAEEAELIAEGLTVGGSQRDPKTVLYCSEKTCNEKGSVNRVVTWTPGDDQPAFETVGRTPDTAGQ